MSFPLELELLQIYIYMYVCIFRSARSLAGSDTPSQSYMTAKSGPPALEHQNDSSSDDENEVSQSNKPVSKPRLIPRSVSSLC